MVGLWHVYDIGLPTLPVTAFYIVFQLLGHIWALHVSIVRGSDPKYISLLIISAKVAVKLRKQCSPSTFKVVWKTLQETAFGTRLLPFRKFFGLKPKTLTQNVPPRCTFKIAVGQVAHDVAANNAKAVNHDQQQETSWKIKETERDWVLLESGFLWNQETSKVGETLRFS